ncbi:hypothetical protein BH10ACI3_BH10ACI3_15730 [soil metagenome]
MNLKSPLRNGSRVPVAILVTFVFVLLLTTSAVAQQRVNVYPTTIRLDKGKSRTVTAIAFDAAGSYMPNQTFTFARASGSTTAAAIRRSPEGNTEGPNSHFSANLGEITGLASGQFTLTATLNNVVSNQVTVNVVDPTDPPQAVIRGDNEAESNLIIRARTGEAIEVNADSAQGVKLVEWFWGDGDRTSDVLSGTHAYLAAGSYTLRLRVTNSGGQMNESAVTVIVTDQPAATRTFIVSTGEELVAAYNQCIGGETIMIAAGTIISGPIVLTARSFSDYVTIRSSATMPDWAVRVSPTQSGLVTFRGTSVNDLPLLIKNRASKIRLSGIKFDPFPGMSSTAKNYYLFQIGEAFGQTSIDDNPTKIIIDHCVVNPPDNIQVVHAILNDGYKVSIIGSWLGNIKTYGAQDSQAVLGLDGRGAHVYNNTYFEAATENVMYGGAGNQIDGLVPTNIEFRRCAFSKPIAWRTLGLNSGGESLNEKNLFESKNSRRVYVEGSLFSNHWDALRSQYYAIALKSASDIPNAGQGSPWSVSEEIVFENNRISHINGAVLVARDFVRDGIDYDALKPQHIRLINNLFDDMTFGRWGDSRGWSFYMAGVDDLLMKHVSVIDAIDTPDEPHEAMLVLNSVNSYRPEIVDSILPLNYYGIRNSCGEGIASMNVGTSGWFDASGNSCGATSGTNAGTWRIAGNTLPKMRSSHSPNSYPAANNYPENYAGVGMQSYRNCSLSYLTDPCNSTISDFSLRPDSAFKNSATDSTDPGINSPLLTERLRCTAAGDTRTCLSAAGSPPASPTATATATPTAAPTATATSTATPTSTPTAAPTFTPTPTPTPFPTTGQYPVPSTVRFLSVIQAENFDRGGEGIGYHEVYGATGSGVYRTQPIETADIQSRSTALGGFAVTEAAAGEWMAYSTQSLANGTFDLGVRYASEFSGGTFHVELDGQNVTGSLTVQNTGNWGIYYTVFKRVRITAGSHRFKIVMDTNSVNPQTGAVSPVVGNFDAIVIRTPKYDFDTDGKSNAGVFRPSSGAWYIGSPNGGSGSPATNMGQSGDIPVADDYDGDGIPDIAVFRPSDGTWYVSNSSDQAYVRSQFGRTGDAPVPADYDGDGIADIAIFRPADGNWWIRQSTDGLRVVNFGLNGDIPVAGDYDGDGRSDIAVFRPSNGTWYILGSRSGFAAVNFGLTADKVAPADYDGDGTTDIAVYRPANGNWWIRQSTGGTRVVKFGINEDIPVPADYDGDGKADIAVFRPTGGTWYINNSLLGLTAFHFGLSGDIPIAE